MNESQLNDRITEEMAAQWGEEWTGLPADLSQAVLADLRSMWEAEGWTDVYGIVREYRHRIRNDAGSLDSYAVLLPK
ncbi:hypothetical protein [Nonomuraea sp. SYSU D8015]|uniref:hypothetical protein n=1 Tax=Nonomuraea sp. SYSU D8015 TaxID=2593644 RepID=UPI0016600A69|nr:hypothetical protein [Nonomuraea sp. SYSU D8015]